LNNLFCKESKRGNNPKDIKQDIIIGVLSVDLHALILGIMGYVDDVSSNMQGFDLLCE
jgi:hypothetical protein